MDFPSFDDLFSQVGDMGRQFSDFFSSPGEEGGGFVALITPVDPFNRNQILAPLIGVAGMISVFLLTGLIVGALAVALASFLAICFVLAEVFGYEFNVAMPEPQA